MDALTEDEVKTIQKITGRGFSVIIFTPEELKGVDPVKFEDILIGNYAWDIIETMRQNEET